MQNVRAATNRFARSLAKMKTRLESDLASVNAILEKLPVDSLARSGRVMTEAHRSAISKGIRRTLRAKKAK